MMVPMRVASDGGESGNQDGGASDEGTTEEDDQTEPEENGRTD